MKKILKKVKPSIGAGRKPRSHLSKSTRVKSRSVSRTPAQPEITNNMQSDAKRNKKGRVVASSGIPQDITERKRAEAALRASEERYRALYDDTPSIYFTVDPDGIVRLVNSYGAAYLGYAPEDLIGQSVLSVFFEDDKETVARNIAECLRDPGQMFYQELRKVRKDGSLLWVKETSRAVPNQDGELVVLMVCEDITERKQAERSLRERQEHSQSLVRLSQNLERAQTYAETLRAVFGEVQNIFGYQNLWVYVLTEDKKHFNALIAMGKESELAIKGAATTLTIKDDRMLEETAAAKDIVVVEDARSDERTNKEMVKNLGMITIVNIPIILFDRRLGYIGTGTFGAQGVRVPTILEQEYLFTMASHMAVTLDRIHLLTERRQAEQALRKSEQRYHGLFEDSPISIWEEDFSLVKQRLDLLREEGVRDFAAFFDAHPEILAECASQIRVVDINNASLKMFGAQTKNELRENLVRVIKNDNFEMFREELIKIANGELDFQWEGPNRTLTGNQMYTYFRWSAMPGFEDTLSRVIISIIDITQRKQHERELEVIVTVSAALRAALTRAEMLPVILDQLLELLRADGTAFAIRDPNSGETVFELGRGDFANSTGLHIAAGIGVTAHVMETGLPYLNGDIRTDPMFVRSDLLGDTHAVACVPLIAHGQTIGALLVGRKTEVGEQEVRLLISIGDIAANAIHRATLFEQTKRRLEHLAALNDIDRAITSSFDLQLNLATLLTQAITQLRVDAADVLLFDPGSQTLGYITGRGFTSKAHELTRLGLGEGYAGRAALERHTINIADIREEPDQLIRAGLWSDEAFISYYAVPLMAKGEIKGVLEIFKRDSIQANEEWLNFLHALAEQATIAVENATLFDDLQRSNTELALAYDATIEGWSRALDLRDKETEGHTQRVTALTVKLAKAMGVPERELIHIRRGALLHDIGKMGVPDHILLKPQGLTDEEWIQMHKHPAYAYEMLSPIAFLHKALDIPYCHHENWDGTGYPRGLKENDIPLAARIFSVVDVYDALTSDRPYRAGSSKEKVLERIYQLSGTQFDPQVVNAFLNMMKKA